MGLRLYNTLTRTKEVFAPLDASNVRLYVCGPTVYDYAHIGNARPIIVFDVLFRLLRHLYGEDHVTYVRNITDVDDKINARAAEEGVSIGEVTARTTEQFHKDIAALGVLPPTVEPRATDHIGDMIAIIERLIAGGFAYAAEGHVLFSPSAMNAADGVLPRYGALSNRSLDEMLAGARVDVAPYKRDAMDFVLWKPSTPELPGWDSPWGRGRPGWHIECSAMSWKHLGERFDIHGGGIDLVFPHHENEIAQSCCAFSADRMANVWMHNGFLQVEGEKMSKSLGNFVTINQLLETTSFGSNKWHGYVLRLAMLATHYRQPIDWTIDRLVEMRSTLNDWIKVCDGIEGAGIQSSNQPHGDLVKALSDDLNTPKAISVLHGLAGKARGNSPEAAMALNASLRFMGLWNGEQAQSIYSFGYELSVGPAEFDIRPLVEARAAARAAKNWAEADRIRDELDAMGVTLKDAKDPATGELVTTWEVKR